MITDVTLNDNLHSHLKEVSPDPYLIRLVFAFISFDFIVNIYSDLSNKSDLSRVC